jgi:hypothetical protein
MRNNAPTAAAVLAAEKELEPIEGVADGLGTFPDTTETVSKAESRTCSMGHRAHTRVIALLRRASSHFPSHSNAFLGVRIIKNTRHIIVNRRLLQQDTQLGCQRAEAATSDAGRPLQLLIQPLGPIAYEPCSADSLAVLTDIVLNAVRVKLFESGAPLELGKERATENDAEKDAARSKRPLKELFENVNDRFVRFIAGAFNPKAFEAI